QEVVDGYHDHEEFVRVVENEHLDVLDEEVRDAMGLVSEKQYRELYERYVQHVLAWTRGERLRNKVTGEMERPDEEMMAQPEEIAQVESTLLSMKERFGYCDNCAKDALLLLLTKRYTD